MKASDLTPEVRDRIGRDYSASDRDAVAVLLADLPGPHPRVQSAVLTLAEGDVDKLLHYARAAELDFRDVLLWAEYPDEEDPSSEDRMRDVLRSWEVAQRYARSD